MADARIAFTITVDPEHEGGFQNNPNDHANWSSGKIGEGELIGTKYGITPADMPGVDIKNLTPEQAIDFYIERYWKPLYSQITSQLVANKLADMGVLFGVGQAVKTLQRVVGANVDGDFGPETLRQVNAQPEANLLKDYKIGLASLALQVANFNPNERQFFPGWVRRINS